MKSFINSKLIYFDILAQVETGERFVTGDNNRLFIMQKTGPNSAIPVHPDRLTRDEWHRLEDIKAERERARKRAEILSALDSIKRMLEMKLSPLPPVYDVGAMIEDLDATYADFEFSARGW
jgi:hypothetical protein